MKLLRVYLDNFVLYFVKEVFIQEGILCINLVDSYL